MEDRQPSQTALAAAAAGAAHLVVDREPLIFRDPVAADLIGNRAPRWSATTVPPVTTSSCPAPEHGQLFLNERRISLACMALGKLEALFEGMVANLTARRRHRLPMTQMQAVQAASAAAGRRWRRSGRWSTTCPPYFPRQQNSTNSTWIRPSPLPITSCSSRCRRCSA
jgi:hypothetical protein